MKANSAKALANSSTLLASVSVGKEADSSACR